MGANATSVVVESVIHAYGRRTALDRASLRVGRGVTTLLGPNGAGKTTLMRLIAGDLRLRGGSIRIDGRALDRRSRGEVGYLPQDPQLFDRFRAVEFVTYAGWLRGLGPRKAKQHALDALALVGLADRLGDKVGTLSGGMRRRLAIAAAVSCRPRVLLLDEPMSGLDPDQQHDVRAVIEDLGRSASVLVATHVLQDVPSLADHVCLLHQGRVAFDGDVRCFLGTAPELATAAVVERAYAERIGPRVH
jgi:ABC-type multidrug transport system ATPase subunit